jgi:putative flippase GtrA
LRLSLRRAAKFGLVGASGLVVQSVVFYGLTRIFGVPDFIGLFGFMQVPWALAWSVVCAASSNYVLNELWTWRTADKSP